MNDRWRWTSFLRTRQNHVYVDEEDRRLRLQKALWSKREEKQVWIIFGGLETSKNLQDVSLMFAKLFGSCSLELGARRKLENILNSPVTLNRDLAVNSWIYE